MKEEDKQRLELESVVMHVQSSSYGITDDNTYYPINHQQVRDLLGKLLTQLDAMNLPERVHLANKAMLIQTVWRWYDSVYENATTSSEGCIAPIICEDHIDSDGYSLSNRWGWDSEKAYIQAKTPTDAGKHQ